MHRGAARLTPGQQTGGDGDGAEAVVAQVLSRRGALQAERRKAHRDGIDGERGGEHAEREIKVGAVHRQRHHTPPQHLKLVVQCQVVGRGVQAAQCRTASVCEPTTDFLHRKTIGEYPRVPDGTLGRYLGSSAGSSLWV